MRVLIASAFMAAMMVSPAAWAGVHTNTSWSSKPDGEGGAVTALDFGRVAYYNFTTATDSPVLPGASQCGQLYTRFVLVSGTAQSDMQACDPTGTRACSDLPNGSDITATTTGTSVLSPSGGVAAALKVNVDSVSGEGEWEVVCGAGGR